MSEQLALIEIAIFESASIRENAAADFNNKRKNGKAESDDQPAAKLKCVLNDVHFVPSFLGRESTYFPAIQGVRCGRRTKK